MTVYGLPVWELPEPGSAAQILFLQSPVCQKLCLTGFWTSFFERFLIWLPLIITWRLVSVYSQFCIFFLSFLQKKFPLIRRGGLNWVWVLIASECFYFVIFGSLARFSSFAFDWFLDYIRIILHLRIFVFSLDTVDFSDTPLHLFGVCWSFYWIIWAIYFFFAWIPLGFVLSLGHIGSLKPLALFLIWRVAFLSRDLIVFHWVNLFALCYRFSKFV